MQEQKKASVEKDTKKAMDNIIPEQAQVAQAMGDEGEEIVAKASGKKYRIRPLGIGKVSQVTEKIQELEKVMAKGLKAGKTEQQVIMENNSPAMEAMAEIIQLGLIKQHPDITVEDVKENFSLGDFPRVYQKVLDLNDFLSGMQILLNQR